MTLILSAIVPGFAVQCSDRRLTRPDGSVFDDQSNKSVIWCNRVAVGFTGLAFINRKQDKPTSEWIAETLCGPTDLQQRVDHLASEAQKAIDRLPTEWPDRRLAMHLSGFLPNSRTPVDLTISNFHHNDGLTVMADTFSVIEHQPGHDGWSLIPIGVDLAPRHVRMIRSALPRLAKGEADPMRVADFLTQLLRQVAKEQLTVGTDAMLTSIPAMSDNPGSMVTDGGAVESITPDSPSFDYRPGDPTDRMRHGPHVVCGETAIGGWTFEPTNESGSDGIMEAKWLRVPSDQTDKPRHPPGRNALCHCGSGLKYKHCHGASPGARRSTK